VLDSEITVNCVHKKAKRLMLQRS